MKGAIATEAKYSTAADAPKKSNSVAHIDFTVILCL
jgi:hypothetical protein